VHYEIKINKISIFHIFNMIYTTNSNFNWRCSLVFICSFTLLKANAQFYIKGICSVSASGSISVFENNFIAEPTAQIINDGAIQNKCVSTFMGVGASFAGLGMLTFSADGLQSIDANGGAIDCNITLNNANNLSLTTLALGSAFGVSNSLSFGGNFTFLAGDLITNSSEIIFKDQATHTSSSNASHINGWCFKKGNDPFEFPVGDGIKLRKAAISAPSSLTDVYACKYFKSNPNLQYNVGLKDPTLSVISLCEYWLLNRITGTSSASISLSWDNSYSCGVSNPSELLIARWNGTMWKDHGNGGTTGTLAAGTIVSASTISSFSPFTLASTTTNNPLPIELISFDANCNNAAVDVKWSTASEHNNYYFSVERSLDGESWINVFISNGAGNSTQLLNYYWTDNEPFRQERYYRLKQTDFDGATSYSNIVFVDGCIGKENALRISPNPGNENVNVDLISEDIIGFQILDSKGIIVLSKTFIDPISSFSIDINSFNSGVYIIFLTSNSGSFTEKFVKLL
jgi:hypothetical protein